MNTVLSVYFDGAIVQAVTVSISGNSVTIRDARTFPFDELGDFLLQCREKSCIVCCNPPLFFQDIIHLPPAASRLYDKLVRTEMLKAHPELDSFSICYSIVGEATIETRLYNKIAVFSYPDDFLSDFITAATRSGMAISHIYAAPSSILRLSLSTCPADPGQPRIVIASLPGEKLLLVSENGQLEFIRKIPSHDSALLPEDANNINMTVDYCFQSLRMRPSETVMLNQPELSEDLAHLVSVPYRSSLPPQLADIPPHIIQGYLAPVAAALHSVEAPGSANILPSGYATFSAHKKLLTAATLVMLLLSLILAGYLVTERMTISGLKTKIGTLRTELSGSAGEIATFRKLDAEANQFRQPLDFINKHNASPNPAAALAALAIPETREYMIKGITIQSGEEFLTVKIEGTIHGSGYGGTQAAYEQIIARIAKIAGYTAVSGSNDIKLKTFSIQARYNGKGKQTR